MCLFAASLFLSSCSKDDDQGAPEGTGSLACSFKVDLEGQQTLPNTYGQDKIILTSGEAELLGMEYFGLQIVQSKGGDSGESVTLTSFIKAELSKDLPLGDYPVYAVVSGDFSTTSADMFPLFLAGDVAIQEVVDGMVLTLLENSSKGMRMKLSGQVMKNEWIEGEMIELGLVPLEAEIFMAADLILETTKDGALLTGGICECQDPK